MRNYPELNGYGSQNPRWGAQIEAVSEQLSRAGLWALLLPSVQLLSPLSLRRGIVESQSAQLSHRSDIYKCD